MFLSPKKDLFLSMVFLTFQDVYDLVIGIINLKIFVFLVDLFP